MSSSSAPLSTPEGPGSVSGAPNLPAGFTFTSRSEHFASPGGAAFDEQRAYEFPERVRFNHWALAGECTIGRKLGEIS